MASCDPFTVAFTGSAQDLYNKVERLVKDHNGTISGGPAGGKFSVPVPVFGDVKGIFAIAGQNCTITITDRSFFLPCGTIEAFARSNIPTVVSTSMEDLVS